MNRIIFNHNQWEPATQEQINALPWHDKDTDYVSLLFVSNEKVSDVTVYDSDGHVVHVSGVIINPIKTIPIGDIRPLDSVLILIPSQHIFSGSVILQAD